MSAQHTDHPGEGAVSPELAERARGHQLRRESANSLGRLFARWLTTTDESIAWERPTGWAWAPPAEETPRRAEIPEAAALTAACEWLEAQPTEERVGGSVLLVPAAPVPTATPRNPEPPTMEAAILAASAPGPRDTAAGIARLRALIAEYGGWDAMRAAADAEREPETDDLLSLDAPSVQAARKPGSIVVERFADGFDVWGPHRGAMGGCSPEDALDAVRCNLEALADRPVKPDPCGARIATLERERHAALNAMEDAGIPTGGSITVGVRNAASRLDATEEALAERTRERDAHMARVDRQGIVIADTFGALDACPADGDLVTVAWDVRRALASATLRATLAEQERDRLAGVVAIRDEALGVAEKRRDEADINAEYLRAEVTRLRGQAADARPHVERHAISPNQMDRIREAGLPGDQNLVNWLVERAEDCAFLERREADRVAASERIRAMCEAAGLSGVRLSEDVAALVQQRDEARAEAQEHIAREDRHSVTIAELRSELRTLGECAAKQRATDLARLDEADAEIERLTLASPKDPTDTLAAMCRRAREDAARIEMLERGIVGLVLRLGGVAS